MPRPHDVSTRLPTPPSGEAIGIEEFCDRFVASMVIRARYDTFANGCKVADYAKDTAPTYWGLPAFRTLGPELCVVSDMRHWHGSWEQERG
jgi:hypothetical protein